MTARPLTLSPTDARRMKLKAWQDCANFPGDCDVAWSRYRAEIACIEALQETRMAAEHLDAMPAERRAMLEREWGA